MTDVFRDYDDQGSPDELGTAFIYDDQDNPIDAQVPHSNHFDPAPEDHPAGGFSRDLSEPAEAGILTAPVDASTLPEAMPPIDKTVIPPEKHRDDRTSVRNETGAIPMPPAPGDIAPAPTPERKNKRGWIIGGSIGAAAIGLASLFAVTKGSGEEIPRITNIEEAQEALDEIDDQSPATVAAQAPAVTIAPEAPDEEEPAPEPADDALIQETVVDTATETNWDDIKPVYMDADVPQELVNQFMHNYLGALNTDQGVVREALISYAAGSVQSEVGDNMLAEAAANLRTRQDDPDHLILGKAVVLESRRGTDMLGNETLEAIIDFQKPEGGAVLHSYVRFAQGQGKIDDIRQLEDDQPDSKWVATHLEVANPRQTLNDFAFVE